jgi:ERCC4-type nuclease
MNLKTIDLSQIPPPVSPPKKKRGKKVAPAKAIAKTKDKTKYRVLLQIDEREHHLHDELSKILQGIDMERCVMPIGDMALYLLSPSAADGHDERKLLQIYERKSVADLLASILDGRYKEQCFRMTNTVELSPHNMVYVIEGTLVKDEVKRRRIFSAMTTLQFFKGMSVMRTSSVVETAELLARTAEKIEREWNEHVSENAVAAAKEYVGGAAAFSIKKSKNITGTNIGEILLCNIPGFSAITAKAVMQRFQGSFPLLMTELMQDSTGANLRDIRVGTRRISQTCVDNLLRFLCNSAPPETASL